MIEDSHWTKKLRKAGYLFMPYLLLSIFLLLNLINIPISYAREINPYFVLMVIYYWSIYRPTLVPPVLCFTAGLLLDILSGVPLGLNAFIFVGAQWLVRDQRRFLMGQPYMTVLAVFGLVAITCGLWQWGLMGLTHMNWSLPVSGALSVIGSILLFPPVSLLLNFIHRMLPVASRSFP